MPIFLLLGVQATYGQAKLETKQQTKEKIQELAALARPQALETPIGSGDLLHIDVFDVPELSRDVRVSDTGDITYPLIPGRIVTVGLTPYQLEQKLAQLLIENGLISHPQVSVFVKEQNSQPVTLVGAVQKPMVYQIIRPTTLLELLAEAGGITDLAGSDVIVTRQIPAADKDDVVKKDVNGVTQDTSSDTQTITIRLQDLLESGNPTYNISIYGGDTVSVPRAGIVYVMGAGIAQPGGYVLQSHGEQITVLKAVALAHGLTGYAKGDQAVIMRNNTATGQRDMIPVHIKQIQNRKADDLGMQSNDILYIPDSLGLKILVKGSEAALTAGTAVAVYR
ncbi:MAG: polysaccharide biosynthesis/export family protein [Candidatus Acidiferrales bacterium]